jgi:hypothetical protein
MTHLPLAILRWLDSMLLQRRFVMTAARRFRWATVGIAIPVAQLVPQQQSVAGAIKGTVVDSQGIPVARASVRLDSGIGGHATDSAGQFLIVGVSPGDHVLHVGSFHTAPLQTEPFRVIQNETTSVGTLVARSTSPREVWLGCRVPEVPEDHNTKCVTGRSLAVPLNWLPRGVGVVRDSVTWVTLWQRAAAMRQDHIPDSLLRQLRIDWRHEMAIVVSSASDLVDESGAIPFA